MTELPDEAARAMDAADDLLAEHPEIASWAVEEFLVPRAEAARQLADDYTSREAWLILPPADDGGSYDVCRALDDVPTWSAYVDNGTELVVVCRDDMRHAARAALLFADQLGAPMVAVFVVPKTVPADTLADALGGLGEVPTDGSQDLIQLRRDLADPAAWPLLFMDALDLVEPDAAAQLRAASYAFAQGLS